MNYVATITNFNFMPMVEFVPSILHIWITTPTRGESIMLEYRGTIEELSRNFQFTIEGPHSWNFTGFIGRQCNITRNEQGYHFVSFV